MAMWENLQRGRTEPDIPSPEETTTKQMKTEPTGSESAGDTVTKPDEVISNTEHTEGSSTTQDEMKTEPTGSENAGDTTAKPDEVNVEPTHNTKGTAVKEDGVKTEPAGGPDESAPKKDEVKAEPTNKAEGDATKEKTEPNAKETGQGTQMKAAMSKEEEREQKRIQKERERNKVLEFNGLSELDINACSILAVQESSAAPKEPTLFAVTASSKERPFRAMALTLDGLLDYDETDKFGSTFEVSLFAEAFHEVILPFPKGDAETQLVIARGKMLERTSSRLILDTIRQVLASGIQSKKRTLQSDSDRASSSAKRFKNEQNGGSSQNAEGSEPASQSTEKESAADAINTRPNDSKPASDVSSFDQV